MKIPIEHLQPFEDAARIHCQRTGVDPDMLVAVPHPTIQGVKDTVPAWHFSAERLLDLSMLLSSMKAAQHKQAANEATH